MRILMVTHWFYPRSIPRAFRSEELYKELLKRGYEVDLIVGDSKDFIIPTKNYKDEIIVEKADNRIKKSKIMSSSRILQCLKKIIEYFIGEYFIITSGKFVSQNIRLDNYDAVISIGLPFYIHLLVAIELNKQKNKKLLSISDWGDPFYGDRVRHIAFYFKWIQKKICQTFDYVVIPTENAKNYYMNYVDSENKLKVIPQGFDFTEVKLKPYKKCEIPTFAYAGIFYFDKRNPTEFLDYLCCIKENFCFVIYTDKHGLMYEKILKQYENRLANKLIIKEMVPRLTCIEELSKYDFLINMNNSVTKQVPSKLIDYALTKRPIYSFSQKEFSKNVFAEFMQGNYEHSTIINLDEYKIENVAQKFIDLMEV